MAFLHWPGMLRWHRAGAEPRLLYRGVSPEVGTGTGTGGARGHGGLCLLWQTDVNKPEFDFQDRLGNIAN